MKDFNFSRVNLADKLIIPSFQKAGAGSLIRLLQFRVATYEKTCWSLFIDMLFLTHQAASVASRLNMQHFHVWKGVKWTLSDHPLSNIDSTLISAPERCCLFFSGEWACYISIKQQFLVSFVQGMQPGTQVTGVAKKDTVPSRCHEVFLQSDLIAPHELVCAEL